MSRENVEVARRCIELLNLVASADSVDVDLASGTALVAPDIEWDTTGIPFPDLSGVYRGRDELLRWWGRWFEAWQEWRYEIEEVIDAGDEVLVGTHLQAKGRDGIETSAYFVNVVTVRCGQVA